MTLVIEESEARELLTFEEATKALEDAYRQYGLGKVGGNSLIHDLPVVPRCEMRVEGMDLPHIHPDIRGINQSMAYLEETGMAVVRISFHLGSKSGLMDCLLDTGTGDMLAIVKAPHVWRMRLGAEGAIGAKHLSRTGSNVAGMIGVGRAGRYLLQAITRVRDINKVYAYAGRAEDLHLTKKYAQDMGELLGIDVIVCEDPEKVVRNADILTTATLSTTPIVKGEWVSEGLHINAFGADDPIKAELDGDTLKKADKLVIDYDLTLETKEFRVPLEEGTLRLEDIYGNIGEVVAGVKPGREKDSEITIFKDTGMTLPYVAIYKTVYDNAVKKGLGKEVDKGFLNTVYT